MATLQLHPTGPFFERSDTRSGWSSVPASRASSASPTSPSGCRCAGSDPNQSTHERAVRGARKLITAQQANWLAVPQAESRPEAPVEVRVGLLGAARAEWQAALIDR